MKRVFIDMDNVLVDFQSGLDQVSKEIKSEYAGRLDEDMELEETQASRQALLNYCKLDTWAMVKVWEKLKEVAE